MNACIPSAPPVLNPPTAVTATTLSLSWTQPGSAVDSYTVSYTYTIRQCGSGPITGSVVDISGNAGSVMLDNLEEDSDYSITLTANRGNLQLNSNVVSVTTSSAGMSLSSHVFVVIVVVVVVTNVAPSGSPSSIMFSSPTLTCSITVQWGEVPCEDRNGEITGYMVQYTADNPPHTGTMAVSGMDNRMAVVSDLLPRTSYNILVRAEGPEGMSDAVDGMVETDRSESNAVICT